MQRQSLRQSFIRLSLFLYRPLRPPPSLRIYCNHHPESHLHDTSPETPKSFFRLCLLLFQSLRSPRSLRFIFFAFAKRTLRLITAFPGSGTSRSAGGRRRGRPEPRRPEKGRRGWRSAFPASAPPWPLPRSAFPSGKQKRG